MKVAHILRKWDSQDWGGIESHLYHLVSRLRILGVESVLFSPRCRSSAQDPIAQLGLVNRRYLALLPVLGLDSQSRAAAISLGGNILSFDLPFRLFFEPNLDLIHAHCINRIGGVAKTVARLRRVPFVVSLHGGYLAMPEEVRREIEAPSKKGVDLGKPFGLLFGSRRVVRDADAVITFNQSEAEALRSLFPWLEIVVMPHGVPVRLYEVDQRAKAIESFPKVRSRKVILCVARLCPVKNQAFLIEQLPSILAREPTALLVLAGAESTKGYAALLLKRAEGLGVADHVLFAGQIPPDDPRLVGLYQLASVVVLASKSEAAGLVVLEAWAAGKPVVASRTAGSLALIEHGKNGFLFDLSEPKEFFACVLALLSQPELAKRVGCAGLDRVRRDFDVDKVSSQVFALYERLLEGKRGSLISR